MAPNKRGVGLVALTLSLGASGVSRGQAQPLPPLDQYHVRTHGPASGLPAANVRGVAQLADGYLYVATGRGLTRFDGHRFRLVPIVGARAHAIEQMHADASGRLWVFGPGNDLMGYFDGGRFRALAHSPAMWVGATTAQGGQWFGGSDGLGYRESGDSAELTRYTVADGLPNDTIVGPFVLAGGEHVAVSWTRLVRVEADSTRRDGFRFVPFGPAYRFDGAVRVDANGLWLTVLLPSGSVGVLRYHAGRFTTYDAARGAPFLPLEWFDWNDGSLAPSIPAGRWRVRVGGQSRYFIRKALRGHNGVLWLAAGDERDTRDELVRYENGQLDTIPLRAQAAFHTINHLFEDHEGSVWVGTDQALFQLSPRSIATLGTRHGLAEQFTVPVIQTRDGALWVGTWGGGLHRFDRGRLTHCYTGATGLPGDHVRALYEAADGTLWVGTNRGMAAVRNGAVVLSEASEHVRAFAETRDSIGPTLWIGTESRLLARTSNGVIAHRPAHWRDRPIWALHTARDGSLWIGSERGLFRLVDDSLHALGPEHGMRGPFVASISEESDGTLWFGTYEHGLHCYRGGRFAALTTGEGLLHDGIWRMLADTLGGVWMSTDAGIFRVDRTALHEVADAVARGERPRRPLSPIVFREAEGMPSRESNRASPGGWRLDDGRLVFNNLAGVVVIDPSRAGSRVASPTAILDVTADGRRVAIDTPAVPTLSAGTKQLAFEFATLSFIAPEQNRYRYRLEAYDDDWVHAGTEERAHYTNLSPGRYTFHVQGASAASPWSTTASVRFAVAPFAWQTWWFRMAALAVIAALGVTAHRVRVRHLVAMERLRLRIASDLHDDVGSNLSSIALLSKMLESDARLEGPERRQLQRINHAAEQTVSALRDIIWLVGPRHDDLGGLVRKMRGITADVLNGTPYRFEADSIESRRVGMTFMRNVLMIYKEALHNVHKHARAREVIIRVSASAGEFTLRIDDDGVGFDESRVESGHGLVNMRRRARESGGRLKITRPEDGGTRITLSTPLAWREHVMDDRSRASYR